MKNALRSLLALTVSASCLALPAQAQANPQSERNEAYSKELIEKSSYLVDARKAISAYFNTHSLKPEQMKEGLTIPWVSLTPKIGLFNAEYLEKVNGFAVATGKTAPNGCPLFRIVAFNHDSRETSRHDAKFGICP